MTRRKTEEQGSDEQAAAAVAESQEQQSEEAAPAPVFAPAEPENSSTLEMPSAGGSYVRQLDGSLKRVPEPEEKTEA